MNTFQNKFKNREISWLEFNQRVLQEADDSSVPLIERIRFLGIFSNNLDEFYKVRYATVKRVAVSIDSGKKIYKDRTAKELLNEISKNAIDLQYKSFKILDQIIKLLESENIHFLNEKKLKSYQVKYATEFFNEKISPSLGIIVLNKSKKIPKFKDNLSFLLIRMELEANFVQHAIIHIPKDLKRFVELPSNDSNRYVMMIDDLIRCHLKEIFKLFKPNEIQANMIKISRDAELDFDDDISKSYLDKISESVKERSSGDPVRFVYDSKITLDSLSFLTKKMKIDDDTDSMIPGGKYHNRRDYMSFPSLNKRNLLYKPIKPLNINGFDLRDSMFETISKKDFLLHAPFHKFLYVINFLLEASIDPKVKSIYITIYRLSKLSKVASALINAAKNGKKVIVQIELQARFDESANIKYAKEMQSQGIKLIFGSPQLKVHSKICLIERKEDKVLKKYGFISTGNFNESTAKVYTDMTLFTSNKEVLNEVKLVFNFFGANYKKFSFKKLIVSPINTEKNIKKLINNEIKNAKIGKPAWIKIKVNNITSYSMIKSLYNASREGVKIQMIIRGVCCLIPEKLNMSDNIEVISIVDKFLEHTRFFIFCNDKSNSVYISSADLMTRNLNNRVEVICPILDAEIKEEILDIFNIYWKDNVKSRFVNHSSMNKYKRNSRPNFRSQDEVYNYYLK
jgi:polyphosphate kinase|tara:strand:- start:2939 stop:4984 length:2046 start_codon:yes stop_codon:yes gene_type:complete